MIYLSFSKPNIFSLLTGSRLFCHFLFKLVLSKRKVKKFNCSFFSARLPKHAEKFTDFTSAVIQGTRTVCPCTIYVQLCTGILQLNSCHLSRQLCLRVVHSKFFPLRCNKCRHRVSSTGIAESIFASRSLKLFSSGVDTPRFLYSAESLLIMGCRGVY